MSVGKTYLLSFQRKGLMLSLIIGSENNVIINNKIISNLIGQFGKRVFLLQRSTAFPLNHENGSQYVIFVYTSFWDRMLINEHIKWLL